MITKIWGTPVDILCEMDAPYGLWSLTTWTKKYCTYTLQKHFMDFGHRPCHFLDKLVSDLQQYRFELIHMIHVGQTNDTGESYVDDLKASHKDPKIVDQFSNEWWTPMVKLETLNQHVEKSWVSGNKAQLLSKRASDIDMVDNVESIINGIPVCKQFHSTTGAKDLLNASV